MKPSPPTAQALIIAVLLAMPHVTWAGVVPAGPEEALIQQFQSLCLIEPPDLDRLSARARGMRLRDTSDTTTRGADGIITHAMVWAGALSTGPYEMLAAQSTWPKGSSVSCAVAGGVRDTEVFRASAVSRMGLPAVPVPTAQPDGGRTWSWHRVRAYGTSITIREFPPAAGPRVMLKLETRDSSRRVTP